MNYNALSENSSNYNGKTNYIGVALRKTSVRLCNKYEVDNYTHVYELLVRHKIVTVFN